MISLNVIKKSNFERLELFGRDHLVYNFNCKKYSNSIILTMHETENTNNLEVLKFALWCKKNDIRITAYGLLNQLPIFSMFADSVILQDKEDWGEKIYPDTPGNPDATHYLKHDLFDQFKSQSVREKFNFNDCIRMHREPSASPGEWPTLLSVSERSISDDEVADFFAFPNIFIREEAHQKYIKMKAEGFLPENLIMCEARVSGGCGGEHLLSVFKEKTKNYPLPICFDLNFRKELCRRSGQDYMAVQVLCSLIDNWMWIAYGGSSNILPFLPVKILSLSDMYCRPDTTRSLYLKRHGSKLGKIFPEFETLIYCFPEEKDGPSRTDGHRPLPNFKDLTLDLSRHLLNFQMSYI